MSMHAIVSEKSDFFSNVALNDTMMVSHFIKEERVDPNLNRLCSFREPLQIAQLQSENPLFTQTALHIAAFKGYERMAALLILLGAKPENESVKGVTPLHCVALFDAKIEEGADIATRMTKLLIQNNADANAKDFVGCTPAYYAAMNGNSQTIRVLADCGANLTCASNQNITPREIALSNQWDDTAAVIASLTQQHRRTTSL